MQCLVTGFDSFGEIAVNPSAETLQYLPSTLDLGKTIPINKLILPTAGQEAWDKLSRKIAKIKNEPLILIMTGLATSRSCISLERFAVNVRDYRIPDNEGRELHEDYIDESGPDALRSNLPLQQLNDYLLERKHFSEVSNHAGSFICNEIYYRALRKLLKPYNALIFVHLPTLGSYKELVASRHASPRGCDMPALEGENTDQAVDDLAIYRLYASAISDIIKFGATWVNDNLLAADS